MSQIDQLIGSLQAEGEYAGEGGFSLDREKAREKMRQFQLAVPHEYVLLLVHAAVLKGATKIAFEIDTDDMRLSFDGEPFTLSDLEDLYGSLFGGRGDRSTMARQQLALALNAAMATEPRFVRLSSGGSQTAVRALLRPGIPDEVEQSPSAGGVVVTTVHVKERVRPSLFVRFFRAVIGSLPEAIVLRQRCARASVPVTINGEVISKGLVLADALVSVPFGAHTHRGVAGFALEPLDPVVEIVVGGVSMTTLPVPSAPVGFVATVECPTLRKDVSQAGLVRDAQFQGLCDAVAQQVPAAIAGLAAVVLESQRLGGGVSQFPPWVRGVLVVGLEWHAITFAAGQVAEHARSLCQLRLWRSVGGDELTTQELLNRKQVGLIRNLCDGVAHLFADDLWVPDAVDRRVLRKILKPRTRDRTSAMKIASQRHQARAEFRSSDHSGGLGAGVYRTRRSFERGEVSGEVGVRTIGSEAATAQIVVDGCCLWEVSGDVGLPGLVMVIVGDFTPTANFDRAHRDATLGNALCVVLDEVEQMMTTWATEVGDSKLSPTDVELFLEYFASVVGGTFDDKVFDMFGVKARRAKTFLKRYARGVGAPKRLGLDDVSSCLRLFRSVAGVSINSREVAAALERGQDVLWVADQDWETMVTEQMFVRADERARVVLAATLGSGLEPGDDLLESMMIRRKKLAEHPAGFEVCGTLTVEFTYQGFETIVGIESERWPKRKPKPANVVVHRERRKVTTIDVATPLPNVVAMVNRDDLRTNKAWTDLDGDESRRTVAEAVLEGVGRIVERLVAEHGEDRAPFFGYLLLRGLSIPFPNPHCFAMYRRMLDDRHERSCVGRMQTLFDVLDEIAEGLNDGMLKQVEAGAAANEIGTTKHRRGDTAPKTKHLRSRVLSLVPRLLDLKVLPSQRGRVNLAEILGEFDREGTVAYVSEFDGPDLQNYSRTLLRLDAIERRLLGRILPIDAIADEGVRIASWRRERELEARQPLANLELPEHEVLVAVAVAEGDIEGSIAIPVVLPGVGGSTVRVCCRRRPIATCQPRLDFTVAGVLSGPTFGSSGAYRSLTQDEYELIESICRRYSEPLIDALADAWPQMVGKHQGIARAWIVWLLGRYAVRSRGRLEKISNPAIVSMASLDVFIGLDGERCSLADLGRDFAEERTLHTCEPDDELPEAEYRVVVLESDTVRTAIDAIFSAVTDYRNTVAKLRAIELCKRAAQPLPRRPVDAVAFRMFDARGLHGQLWTPRAVVAPTLHFGEDGKTITSHFLPDMLPVDGAIMGDGLKIDDTWTSITLRGRQRDLLRNEALALYRSLTDRFMAKPDALENYAAVAKVLRSLLLWFERDLGAGGTWQERRWRRLHRDLRELPLFMLRSGRYINLHTIMRERPAELADVWVRSPTEGGEHSVHNASAPAAAEVEVRAEIDVTPTSSGGSEAPPRPPTARELLVEAVRHELRMVRVGNEQLLGDGHLEQIVIGTVPTAALAIRDGGRLTINDNHPVVQRAIDAQGAQPLIVSIVVSATYTALNLAYPAITNEHEALFHRLHAEHVGSFRGGT